MKTFLCNIIEHTIAMDKIYAETRTSEEGIIAY